MSTGIPDPDVDPNTTASTIVGTTSSGAHVLTVECYSVTKVLIPTGSHVSSSHFPAGRYSTWHLAYYPNGDSEENSDHVSIFLVLDNTAPVTTVVADFTISLLDEAGEPVPGHSKSIRNHRFAACGPPPFDWRWPRAGFPDFVGREELERSGHLRDDRFSVRCDVVVFECRTVSGVRPRPQGQLVADGETAASLAVPGSPWGGVEWWDGREDMFSLDELLYGLSPVDSQQPGSFPSS
ncbi:unnamed protein product [Urochloa humidicola]